MQRHRGYSIPGEPLMYLAEAAGQWHGQHELLEACAMCHMANPTCAHLYTPVTRARLCVLYRKK